MSRAHRTHLLAGLKRIVTADDVLPYNAHDAGRVYIASGGLLISFSRPNLQRSDFTLTLSTGRTQTALRIPRPRQRTVEMMHDPKTFAVAILTTLTERTPASKQRNASAVLRSVGALCALARPAGRTFPIQIRAGTPLSHPSASPSDEVTGGYHSGTRRALDLLMNHYRDGAARLTWSISIKDDVLNGGTRRIMAPPIFGPVDRMRLAATLETDLIAITQSADTTLRIMSDIGL